MISVFGMSDSGNCYKLRLALEQLQVPYRWEEVDSVNGGTRTAEFLAMNPNGKVPTVRLENGEYLSESNAILFYLADGSALWPQERLLQARVLQWMFFEQYSHEPYIAVARYICRFLPPDHARRAELPRLHERGAQALQVMETHLSRQDFFGGSAYSIADIALFAYTHKSAEGRFDLAPYPAIRRWIERVAAQPRFVPMVAAGA
ncbi:glutathione S-transferase family protein [Noviherbaspirillum denitrificans]|uniref:Glutathione S-transferase n=1 Tax=Noviherbaspirillum denitrificans TaxID=1968433 RepID=A0A254TED7_9BURK|nr:glutathione S-transferase family protein [Noviherbaspirillum denitrificans]OWW21029.1 glutathione S-transferase [Noviherbaspirillum denitrificans]